MKPNLENLLIRGETKLQKAMELMGEITERILLVTNKNLKLIGTITDGDIRRALIKKVDTNVPVSKIMRKRPITAKSGVSNKKLLEIMTEKEILAIPIVDESGKIQDVQTILSLSKVSKIKNTVLIMAGGYGRRLGSLTKNKPKPLLKVQDVPLLEKIIQNLSFSGFENIIISTHYKAEMIQKHFGTGRKWDVNIKYIFEKKPLGTAGCLRLLSQEDLNSMPLVVTNSDLVTDIDFKSILSFHSESKTKATICVSEYDMMIPFGVIRLKGNIVEEFLEKPVEKFFINAGIYVLDHRVLNDLDSFENKFDMNNLIDHLTKKGEKVGAFPIYEYWMDVGQLRDFKKVKKDFKNKN